MKHNYVLLDFGGDILAEAMLTEKQAKELNDILLTETIFRRWTLKINI